MAAVNLEGVSKIYGDGTKAVDGLNLAVEDGELVVLVGPSGCGKTTALRMVAGLEEISSGTIRIGDRPINGVPPRDRDVAMVFQSYALYPHMTVRDNIGFALRLRKMDRQEIDRRVKEAARILDLEGLLDRKPAQLSGGQRQRVAMGRAIVREPALFLMDEPLSNLDAKLRVQMRAEISRLQRRLGVTTIYVTHDQVEAMTMGDRVAVLNKGRLQQVDHPQVLYDRPANLFVAAFIGSPAMNLFEGTLSDGDGSVSVALGDQELKVPPAVVGQRPSLRDLAGRRVAVGIRPEDLKEATHANGGAHLRGEVELVEALGSEALVHFRLGTPPVQTSDVIEGAEPAAGGNTTGAGDDRGRRAQAEGTARFDPHSRVQPGGTVDMAVDPARLHFFDLQTSEAVR